MDINKILKSDEYSFLRNEKRLGDNILLLTFGGSISYGTNGPQSDIDIRGIVAPTKEDILGSPTIKHDYDKGNKNLVFGPFGFEQYNHTQTDTVIYGLDKILKLLYKANPNTIEILGCIPEHYGMVSDAGRILIDNRRVFLSKLAFASFSGYARQQLFRLKNALARDSMSLAEKQFYMIDVVERMYKHLETQYPTFKREFVDFYVTDRDGNPLSLNNEKVSLNELVFTYKDTVCTSATAKGIGLDLNDTELRVNVNANGFKPQDLTSVYNEIAFVLKDFSSHIGHRNQKKDDYHLNKHAMHLIRLYLMGIDIFEKNDIITYRSEDRDFLLDIKNGKYQMADGNYSPTFYKMVDNYEVKLKEAVAKTSLPEVPNSKAIEDIVIQIKQSILNH